LLKLKDKLENIQEILENEESKELYTIKAFTVNSPNS
tara:strand:+ start:212 stop:322 length:111 start_codon:yes stop_codon:yes gene_type:complete